jgi:hypothetical protein
VKRAIIEVEVELLGQLLLGEVTPSAAWVACCDRMRPPEDGRVVDVIHRRDRHGVIGFVIESELLPHACTAALGLDYMVLGRYVCGEVVPRRRGS